MSEAGGVRIGDSERQAAVEMLRRHTSEGRLTLDEFSDLAGEVYAALTREELDAILAKLPEGVRPTTPRDTGTPSTVVTGLGDRSRQPEPRRRFVAFMCSSQVRGQWRAPRRITARAFWGHVYIDLRNALIESPVVEVRARAIMGGVTITVPPGIPVELDGFVLMGGAHNGVRNEDPIPGAPLVRVKARGLWGGVTVRNPGSRGRHRPGHHHRHHDDPQWPFDDARHHAENALDIARNALDRALPPRSTDDRIPRMPTPRSRATPTTSHTPATGGASSDASASAPPTDRSSPTPGASSPTSSPASPPTPATPTTPATPATPSTPASRLATTAANGDSPAPDDSTSRDRDRPRRIPAGTLTMLVSDIAGSTQMTERLGDQAWSEVLSAHNAVVRGRVADHGGTEVKAQGDGFLVVFPSARAAVLAAIAIQRAMRDFTTKHPDLPVRVRLGLHTGEVAVVDDDVFGQNVVVACRIADTADAGEIVVSAVTRELAASASDLGFDEGQDIDLKGLSQKRRVHRVLWS